DNSNLTKSYTIKPAEILGVSLEGGEYLFDGNEYGLEVEGSKTQFGDKITAVLVTKDSNGETVTNKISAVGVYTVVATISAGSNYETKTLEATLVIKSLVIEAPKTEEQEKPSATIETEKGFAPGTMLEATSTEYKLTETPEIEISTLKASERVAMVYKVRLVQNGEEIATESTVTIKLLVPENLANANFRVLSVVDGEEVELAYELEDGYALIQTDSLQTFVIVYEPTNAEYIQQYLLYIIIGALVLILVIAAIVIIAIKGKKHVINFVTGDMEVAGGNVGAMKVRHGSKVSLPEPSVSGMYFDGWYSDENCTKKANVSKEDGFTPLYAKNGVNGRKGQAKMPGAFVKNIEFQGWYTDANCTQKADLKKLGKKDVTLYAKWGSKRRKSNYPLWIDKD
ncbi:MAG: InlB B-repeat-containing protein, partial [Clostridia bacterium]|nr:InlB B-repeat-containing protein [Clostridia bacterium]